MSDFDFDAATDQILAKQKKPPRPSLPPPRHPGPDILTFQVEVESVVGRMVRQVRYAEEGQARAVLRAAFNAGADAVAQCCGCSGGTDEEFDQFIQKLIQEVKP